MFTQKLTTVFRLVMLVLISMLVVACGEDDNSNPKNTNNPSPTAVITAENADAILMASLESIQAKAGANEALQILVAQLKPGNTAIPPKLQLCGASKLPDFGATMGNSIALSNFCILTPNGMEVILNGTINFQMNGLNSVTINTESLQITTPNNGDYSLTLEITADKNNVAFSMTLAEYPSGVEISTASLEVVGGMFTGITQVNGSIMVANFGSVEVNMLESDPVMFECTAMGVPSSGTIEVTGTDNSSASITFNDCNSYTITVDGNPGVPILW